MCYLISECNYGGKVTDHWDKRVLNVLLEQSINEDVIKDEKYSLIYGNDKYRMPVRNDYKDFIQMIEVFVCVGDMPILYNRN